MIRSKKNFDSEKDKISLSLSSEDENEAEEYDDGHSPYDTFPESDDGQSIDDPFPETDSDSDSAPQILSFKSAQEQSQQLKKETAKVIITQKKERQKKRREIQLQNMLQKEEKKRKIELKKLPDSILEDLDKYSTEETPDLTSTENPIEPEVNEDPKSNASQKEFVAVHGSTVFTCKVLSVESKKPKYVPENIINYKERALYGGRIKREKSARDAFLRNQKQLVNAQRKPVHM